MVGDLGDQEDMLVEDLRQRLRAPGEVHEDAPDIRVRVPIRATDELDRTAFASAVERVATAKNFSVTRDAVSTLRAFVATPFDAAAAVSGLSTEDRRRDLRLDEVRYGLARVPEAHVMPWLSHGARKLVATLLEAHDALSVSEICERADVERSTWYANADVLKALDIIRDCGGGWRLALPFRDTDEFGIQPWWTCEDSERDDLREASVAGIVLDLLDELAPGGDRLSRVASALRGPTDLSEIVTAWPLLEDWLPVFQGATAEHRETPSVETEEPVVFGRRPEQLSLQAAARGGASA